MKLRKFSTANDVIMISKEIVMFLITNLECKHVRLKREGMAVIECSSHKDRITVNDFLDTLMSDPGPQCLLWLPLLHRMANVENVFHPVMCDVCQRESFMGFRYKCQRCYNMQLCQDCFWRGKITGTHTNDHEVKEYSSYKSPAKQLSHSLRKSFRCVPSKDKDIPRFPDTPEKKLDLSNIVPATPTPVHNGFPMQDRALNKSVDVSSLDGSGSASRSRSQLRSSCADQVGPFRTKPRYIVSDILVSQLGADNSPLPGCKFTIEDAAILHPIDVANPAQPALSEH
ncbi:PREDICTED: dystrobrevin alpha-like, partial [Priapulus caudatus]|uniref:Dystrobrevin alpha-like n=1 Tax=Priapulus caudatus TaxID=37621 RepID=A0ABM1EU92_PRICU